MNRQFLAILAAVVVAVALEMTTFSPLTYAYRASHNAVKYLVSLFHESEGPGYEPLKQEYVSAERWSNDESIEVQKAAVFAIADGNADAAITALADVFRSTKETEIQKAVAYALGDIEGDDALQALVDILDSAADTEVRKAALYAISDRSDVGVLDILVRTTRQTSDIEVAKAAVYQIGDHAGDSDAATRALGDVLTDSPLLELRKAAVYALEDAETSEAIPILKQVLTEDGNPEVRKAAAYALGDIATDEATRALVSVTIDK